MSHCHPRQRAIRTGRVTRALIYLTLLLFALFYLLPLSGCDGGELGEAARGDHRRQHDGLPEVWTLEPWRQAWSTAQIGVEPTGLRPYFWNSIKHGGARGGDLHDPRRAQRLCADQMAVPRATRSCSG